MTIKERRLDLEKLISVSADETRRLQRVMNDIIKTCPHEHQATTKDSRLYSAEREYRTFTVTFCDDCGLKLKEVRER